MGKLPVWDRQADGQLQVLRLASWSVLAFPNGSAGGLRVEFTSDCSAQPTSEQFSLTPNQARELSRALGRLAGQLEGQAFGSRGGQAEP